MESYIIVRRFPYEEPYHTQLEIIVSNGLFRGRTDFYCGVDDLGAIGRALRHYSGRPEDEYSYRHGSENSEDRFYRYFAMRIYAVNALGRCAVQIALNNNETEPDEAACRFSIQTHVGSINRLGELFENFQRLKHLEFKWTPNEALLFEFHQSDGGFLEASY